MAMLLPEPGMVPSRGLMQTLMTQDMQKQKDRANLRTRFGAAANAVRDFEDPANVASNAAGMNAATGGAVQAPEVIPSLKTGTGPGAASERPPRSPMASDASANSYYGGVKAVKDSRGRVTFTSPDEAIAHQRAGATPMDLGQAVEEAGDPRGSTQDLTGAVEGSHGSVFMQPGRAGRPAAAAAPPGLPGAYSDRVRALADQGYPNPQPSSSPEYDWKFTGGNGAGQREGTRTLDPLEQATARRAWLDSRADAERAKELEDAHAALAQALVEQQTQQARLAPVDATTLKRLDIQAKAAPELVRERADVETRARAAEQFRNYTRQLEPIRQKLLASGKMSPQDYLKAIEHEREMLANIMEGHVAQDPRLDPLAALAAFAAQGQRPQAGETP